MEKKFCCEELEYYTTETDEGFKDTSKLIYHDKKFDEFGIIIHDGGESYVEITHYPWSGDKLSNSKRLKWFEELPQEFKSDEWFNRDKISNSLLLILKSIL